MEFGVKKFSSMNEFHWNQVKLEINNLFERLVYYSCQKLWTSVLFYGSTKGEGF